MGSRMIDSATDADVAGDVGGLPAGEVSEQVVRRITKHREDDLADEPEDLAGNFRLLPMPRSVSLRLIEVPIGSCFGVSSPRFRGASQT